jgi:hypothetical protein
MTITLNVHKTRRFHLVRFHRAVEGVADARYPDPDDRGYLGPEFGPIVSVLVGRTVTVRLMRLSIDPGAPLFVKSSDPATLAVHSPRGGAIRSGPHADIEITGVSGGHPKIAKLEVRFQSLTGPILHEMTVWVLTPLHVVLVPHVVTIAQAGVAGSGRAPTLNLASLMPRLHAIWVHYGITFRLNPAVNDAVSFAAAGIVGITEIAPLLGTNWIPGAINIYQVKQILDGGTLGFGFSRTSLATTTLRPRPPNPGLLLADNAATDPVAGAHALGHEIGHFFGLWHPENSPSQATNPAREDIWSRRHLMHNYANLTQAHNWKDNVGWGNLKPGEFVSIKHLPRLRTDAECTTARGVVGGSGPY